MLQCFLEQCGGAYLGYFEPQEPVYLTVVAYFQIPKSTSKVKRAEMQMGFLRPTKIPDLDNVVKAILDGVQVAMHNDSQVVAITASKHYSDNPHAVVVLSNVGKKGEQEWQTETMG